MRIGLFGFPMTGKSTLFHLLTGVEPQSAGARREAQVGVSKVPDDRLDWLTARHQPKKHTPATIEYLDLAGIGKGEAATALPLDQLRKVDALAHVVRGFADESIPHVEGTIDPARDVATMETEFILADHTIAERRVEKLELRVKKMNRDEDRKELALMRRVLDYLEREVPLRNVEFDESEAQMVRGFTFLSLKPLLVVINVGEDNVDGIGAGPAAYGLEEIAGHPATEVVALSVRIEAEITQLDPESAQMFLADLGIEQPALHRMIRASYRLLDRISFFTSGPDECRAWTIRRGTSARRAAGVIHSDIERGFIRAEIAAHADLTEAGSTAACRDRGTLRLEGKDYVMKDGDVVDFRFNV